MGTQAQVTRQACKVNSGSVRESEQPYALGTGMSVTYAPDFTPGKAAWLVRFAEDTDARKAALLEAGWTLVDKRGAVRMYDSPEAKAQVQALTGTSVSAPKAKPSSTKSQASKPAPKAKPSSEPKVTVTHVGTPAPKAATPEPDEADTSTAALLRVARKRIVDLEAIISILEARLEK